MLIKGQNPSNIKFGNTFTVDGLKEEKFDYMLSNPPFGVDWQKMGRSLGNKRKKYEFNPLRSLSEIKADILELEESTFGKAHKVLEI